MEAAAVPARRKKFHEFDLDDTIREATEYMSRETHTDTAKVTCSLLRSLIPVLGAIKHMEADIEKASQSITYKDSAGSIYDKFDEMAIFRVQVYAHTLSRTLRLNIKDIKNAVNNLEALVNYAERIEDTAVVNAHTPSTFRIFGD